MTTSLFVLFMALAASTRPLAPPAKYWYAEPAKFTAPAVVLTRLTKLGCLIPQSGAEAPLENLISGHFIARNRLDYAALCSDRTWSTVLVVNGNDGSVIARLNRQRDSEHVTPFEYENGLNELFVRQIDVVKSAGDPFCLVDADDCPCSGKTYDGIVDIYEKWSETHCWENGWQTVTSGD